MKVTPIDEIRAQVEPEIIEIPGFRPGTVISVAVRPVLQLTPRLLAAGLANPLLISIGTRAKAGTKTEDLEREAASAIDEKSAEAFMGLLDLICRDMLVEPTYEQLVAIHPLTLEQQIAIAAHALSSVSDLRFFRGE